MADRNDLIQKADDLKKQAEQEHDETIRERMLRMAEHYTHLAESTAWSEAHPASAASLGEVFSKRE